MMEVTQIAGNENQNLAEQLSHNLLYHLYPWKSGKGDSKNDTYKVGLLISKQLKTIGLKSSSSEFQRKQFIVIPEIASNTNKMFSMTIRMKLYAQGNKTKISRYRLSNEFLPMEIPPKVGF